MEVFVCRYSTDYLKSTRLYEYFKCGVPVRTWLISSIPLLANSNTSSLGCTAVVMFGSEGSELPKIS